MKPKIVIMAPTPPPVMGPSIATKVLLDSDLDQSFRIKFIDTADRRTLRTLARIDLKNVCLAFLHAWRLFWANMFFRPRAVYFLVNQTTIGYLRDSVFMMINRLFGRRQIVHLRGGYFPEYYRRECGALMRWYIRLTLGWVDRFIVLCKRSKQEMRGIIDEDKVVVVPNGRKLPEIEGGVRKDGLVVLYLGNLIRSKGFFDLLHAAPDVAAGHPSVSFKFAGSWRSEEDRREAEAFIEGHGLKGKVEFTGPVTGEAKYSLLAQADVFVFPTYYKYEGHPWVIVEALAAGLPIITTNHACIPESIEDGVNGFIIPKRNVMSIVEKITTLIGNRDMLNEMSEASRKIYRIKFTSDNFIEAIVQCLNSVIK